MRCRRPARAGAARHEPRAVSQLLGNHRSIEFFRLSGECGTGMWTIAPAPVWQPASTCILQGWPGGAYQHHLCVPPTGCSRGSALGGAAARDLSAVAAVPWRARSSSSSSSRSAISAASSGHRIEAALQLPHPTRPQQACGRDAPCPATLSACGNRPPRYGRQPFRFHRAGGGHLFQSQPAFFDQAADENVVVVHRSGPQFFARIRCGSRAMVLEFARLGRVGPASPPGCR